MSPLWLGIAVVAAIWSFPGTKAPEGYAHLCDKEPTLPGCSERTELAEKNLTYDDLREVNTDLNQRIKYVPDIEKYKQPDYWAVALTEGDCEDYVLAKMQELVRRGWPVSRLRIALTRDHALLYARLNGEDYVLDNTTPYVWASYQVQYSIIEIQSSGGTNKWVPWYKYLALRALSP